jgi:hypothetical protein
MAHTNSTTNYELSQFVGTDKPTFLGDYNGDMQKIDAAIKASKDTADGASTTANAASALATSASETATTAASAAASADANATTALNTANGATTTANSALSAATTAASTATSAAETATAADTKATAAGTAQGTSYTAPVGSLATNVKEALDEIYAGAGGEHGLYELWANPSPTADFAAGNVVLSNFDATKWDAIEIEWAEIGNESLGVDVKRYEKGALINNVLGFNVSAITLSANGGKVASYVRHCDVTLDTTAETLTFAFGDAHTYTINTYGTAAVDATNNGVQVPVRILGLAHNS